MKKRLIQLFDDIHSIATSLQFIASCGLSIQLSEGDRELIQNWRRRTKTKPTTAE